MGELEENVRFMGTHDLLKLTHENYEKPKQSDKRLYWIIDCIPTKDPTKDKIVNKQPASWHLSLIFQNSKRIANTSSSDTMPKH